MLANLLVSDPSLAKPPEPSPPAKEKTPAAEAPSEAPPLDSASAPRDSRPFGGRKWSLGATAGYYATTGDVYGLKVDPFGAGFGLAFSWMLDSGIWFGAHGQYFLGGTISQVYEPAFSTLQIPIDAQTQASTLAAEVGFDLSVGPVVARYALDLGATFLSWDFGDVPYTSLAGFTPMQGSLVGMHVATGVGVLLPLGPAFVGGEFRYRLELSPQIPNAMGGHLHLGWRL